MDISKLAPTEKVLEIKHPVTDEDIGIKVVLVSLTDDRSKAAKREFQDRQNYLSARGKTISSAEIEKHNDNILFASIVGWDWYGDVNFNGAKPAFNRDNMQAVFTKLPWFKVQISEELAETNRFIAA